MINKVKQWLTAPGSMSSASSFAATYLNILSLIGIAMSIVGGTIAGLLPTESIQFELLIPLIVSSILIQFCVRTSRLESAGHLFMLGAVFVMLVLGRLSHDAFLLSTAGYLSMLFSGLLLLPNRQLVPYLVISLVCIFGNEFYYLTTASSLIERDYRILLSISQNTLLFGGVGLVWQLYKTIQDSAVRLEADAALLKEHSAELEASYEALSASEARYRVLVEHATEAIVVTELETWKIVDANAHAQAIFGYSLEELKQFTTKELTSKNVDIALKEAWLPKRAQLYKGNPIEFFTLHTDSNGRDFEAEVRLALLPGTSPQLVRASVIDITERRRKERESREADERLRLLTDNMPVRLAYITPEHKIVSVNREFLNYSQPQTGEEMTISSMLGPEVAEKTLPHLEKALKGDTVSFEFEAVYADGMQRSASVTYVPHITDGEIVGVFGMGQDVTDARRSARELKETTAFLRLITDNMPARLAYFWPDGTLFFLNQEYERAGFNLETVAGKHYLALVPQSVHPQIVSMVARAMQGERVSAEVRYTLPSGCEAIDNVLIVPNQMAEGIHGFIMLSSDLTEQRQAEDSLRQRQRLESLGILAGGIAHDFNNLLVAMLGQSSLAAAKMADDHPARRHVSRATDAAERAAMLTRQMLAYSGRGSFAIAPFNLNQVIEDNLSLFETSIDNSIRLVVAPDPSIDLIEGDTAQFQQVVMNLLLNAAQAMGNKPGTITISTGTLTLEKENQPQWKYTATVPAPGRYVKLEVKDSGIGMDEKTRDRIFDPFFTTKDTGSGLGLAAVLGIVRGHNGVINVESEPGCGTTFSLYFPAATDDQMVVDISAEPLTLPSNFERYVLIIDDDESVTESVADMLEFDDIKVLQANSGVSGIQRFRECQDQIGLVLLDLTMPEMGGEEVFHALREIDPEVKVILSSGYSREEATSHFVGRSLADFLQKPYHHETLRTRVRALFTKELASAVDEATDTARVVPTAESQLIQ